MNPHQFARDGVTLLGHAVGADGGSMSFAPDLMECLTRSDKSAAQFKQNIDNFIARSGIDAPGAPSSPELRDGYDAESIERLDLHSAGIGSIVWATGYRYDYRWIKLPILDQDDYPIQQRGVSDFPGLYFVGLFFMHTRRSGLLSGVAADAEHVARHIAAQS